MTRYRPDTSTGQPPRDTTVAHGGAPAADVPDGAPTLLPDVPLACSPDNGPTVHTDAPTDRVVAVEVPIVLRALGNRREHPLARARRTRREIAAVLGALAGRTPPQLPVVVLLVRAGWNRLDVDGLVSAVKAPVDALARWLGVDDRDPRLHWHLAQSVTRQRRFVRNGMGHGRWETACALRIVVRPWEPSDSDDPLRVLAVRLIPEAP